MKRCGAVFHSAIFFGALIAGAQTIDQTKPYGRACVTLTDSAEKKEALLDGDARPGPERTVTVYLDANQPCEAVAVAFARADGALANGWRPGILALGKFAEETVPAAGNPWAWTKMGGTFDVMVAFFLKESPDAEKVRGLVAKLREGKGDAALMKRQAGQLREVLQGWAASDTAVAPRPESQPMKVAGAVRSGEFPWRDYARQIPFAAEKPGVIVFRHDAAR